MKEERGQFDETENPKKRFVTALILALRQSILFLLESPTWRGNNNNKEERKWGWIGGGLSHS
jgi:hypothetical protein